MRPRTPWGGALVVLTCAALGAPLTAAPAGAVPSAAAGAAPPTVDVRHVDDVKTLRFRDERGRSISKRELQRRLAASASAAAEVTAAADGDTPVGTERLWVTIDFVTGGAYLKNFVLRDVGEHIEVWTASGRQDSTDGTPESTDLDFPDGDCRNGVRTQVTDAQIDRLIDQYDGTILPIESDVFSVAPDRDGSGTGITGADFSGGGDNVVTLIDNVRDENFYDTDNSQGNTYVAGFFSSGINELVDRNVMTIDGFDWLHRTGDDPPDEPSSDLCTNAPARANLYEGVFAHEYQHLLMSYEDPEEVNWVNEGLSDYAQTVTGYVDPSIGINNRRFDSHVQCFLGYATLETPANTIPREGCGPSNSLTLWGDQGDDNILADYGAAYTMMEFLAGRYGVAFMTALHREDAEGFAGLQNVLDQFADGTQAADVLHDWAAMVAVDRQLDRYSRTGSRLARYSAPSLRAHVLWTDPEAYMSATEAPTARVGAPPNGSDYVRLRRADGHFLTAKQLRSLSFEGSQTVSKPVEWTVDESPEGHDSAALYSGTGNSFDRSIAREVTVPADDATLTFETRWSTEEAFDSGFVQISTDGGKTWTSLGNEDTVDELDPGADPTLVDNLPGFNGEGGWKSETFDLSAYAGQEVLLGFRYVSDVNTNGEGWWVDDVTVGGELVSDGSDLEGWRSYSELVPTAVPGFTLQLVSYTSGPDKISGSAAGRVRVVQVPLGEDLTASLDRGDLRRALGRTAGVTGAIVTFDDPSESIDLYAPYRLTVNGVLQPGGQS